MGQSWVILETPGGRPGVSVRCVGAIFGPPGASWGRLWGRGILGESWAPGLFGAKKCERLQHLKKTQGFFNMFGLSGASWGASCRRLVAFGLPLGSWAMVAAFRGYLGSHLGRLGDLGDRFDGVWVPEELGEGGMHAGRGSHQKIDSNPTRQRVALHSSAFPRGRWRIDQILGTDPSRTDSSASCLEQGSVGAYSGTRGEQPSNRTWESARVDSGDSHGLLRARAGWSNRRWKTSRAVPHSGQPRHIGELGNFLGPSWESLGALWGVFGVLSELSFVAFWGDIEALYGPFCGLTTKRGPSIHNYFPFGCWQIA